MPGPEDAKTRRDHPAVEGKKASAPTERHGESSGKEGNSASGRPTGMGWAQWLAAATAIIGIVGGLINLSDWYADATSPHGISIDLLSEEPLYDVELNGDGPIEVFNDEVEPDKVAYFNENCATQLIVRNHDEQTATFTKFRFVAEEIEPICRAELDVYPDTARDDAADGGTGGGVSILIGNAGWLDATSLTCTVSCDDPDFAKCFGKSEYSFGFDDVRSGETASVRVLSDADVVEAPSEKREFKLKLDIASADGEESGSAQKEYWVVVNPDGTFEWGAYGVGDGRRAVFGIRVDTSEPTFEFEAAINESVRGKDNQSFPVCFFPDKSCRMKCYIELSLSDGQVASTPVQELEFDIDARARDGERFDATSKTGTELAKAVEQAHRDYYGTVAVAFPFPGYLGSEADMSDAAA